MKTPEDGWPVVAPGVANISVLQFLGFTEPVTLSATGVPAGATAAFVPSSVLPGGASTLTVSGTGGAAPGGYPITITGTSAPSSFTHDTAVALDLFGAVPGAIDLVAPADGALNQPQRPSFQWTAATQAAGYRLQVATDAAFASVVMDVSDLPEASHTPA